MTRSFGTIVPPARKTLKVEARDDNGAELSITFRALDIPTAQEASTYAYKQIRQYTPHNLREMVPVAKTDPDPAPFPAAPCTGFIVLNEMAAIECATMFYSQFWENEEDALPFVEFVYMRVTAPNCYKACQDAITTLGKEKEDLAGNQLGGGGAE